MGLSLVAGPAHAGKIALLLERYLERLDEEPFLIVPTGSDIERVERDLLRRAGCLMGGTIGTFDDLFRRLAGPDKRTVASDAQRTLLVRAAVASVARDGAELSSSARYGGFADALGSAISELESGLLDPADLDGDLARLYTAYRAELDRLGFRDRDLLRRQAAERLAGDFDAWHGEPVFAYGFEDLTAAEWMLLETLAGRADVSVSLPYEPGRAAFASLRRTAEDLAGLADGRTEELGPRFGEVAPPALAHLERTLFEPAGEGAPPAIAGADRFLEGSGTRATLDLAVDDVLAQIRAGTAPEQIAIVVPSLGRLRAPLETALGSLGVPFAVEGRARLGSTLFGQALLALLRFAWAGGTRSDLFAFLRSPYSGVARGSVDFVEGRLRGRAISDVERVEEETERLREAPLVPLRNLRVAESPIAGVRELVTSMLRSAHGLEAPPVGDSARSDLECLAVSTALLDELEAWEAAAGTLRAEDVLASLERAEVRLAGAEEAGKVAVLDLNRVRTRSFDVVVLVGLEEGSLPRRGRASPFLDDDRRRNLGHRLERVDQVSRDRYLFYTACTRAAERLVLVREAADDEGTPRVASPFWQAVIDVFDPDDVRHATQRRALSQLTWPLDTAPTERERLRALARIASDRPERDAARALADANGWSRRLDRALGAFQRKTALRNPAVVAQFANQTTFAATALERFVDCSSAWLVERVVDPKTIDAEADALLRGKVAHQALYTFYSRLPKELGSDRVTHGNLESALLFLVTCLDDALRGGVRIDLGPVATAELRESLRRDLERFVHEEAASENGFVPRRFEVGFGTERSAPELQRGLDLGDGLALSGKIDRIDVDPFSARGIVQDYKSGKGAFSAREIESQQRLQIPLYMLVLRDLVGIEPMGGVYQALSGASKPRGMLREEATDDLPGYVKNDFLEEDVFWGQVEVARTRAHDAAMRIRSGDVRHDPKGGECPSWCDLWTICRKERA